jgi:MoaA/NifB/PqqE/SkfB family radical SAM enzyme
MGVQIGNAEDKDLYRQGFLSLYTEVTSRCNLGCPHCLRNPKDKGGRLVSREVDPKLEDLAKLRDNLESVSLNNTFYELSGGEPLMRKDWKQVFELFLETKKPVYLFTNAILVDDAVAYKIRGLDKRYPGQIIVNSSLDSHLPEIHNGTRGKYEETVIGLKKLENSGVKLKVNVTLNSTNLPHIEKTVDFIAKNFTKSISLSVLRPVFPISDWQKLFISYDDALNVSARATEHAAEKGWEIYTTFNSDGSSYCGAGENHLLITTNGDVTPCYCLRQSSHIMGNLYKDSFKTILERIATFNEGRDRRRLLCEHLEEVFGIPPFRMEKR